MLQRQGDVLAGGEMGVKIKLLENKARGCAAGAVPLPESWPVGLLSIRISPPLRVSSWLIRRIRVDLPEPEGPRIATTSPGNAEVNAF
jgi:hypothetical protein